MHCMMCQGIVVKWNIVCLFICLFVNVLDIESKSLFVILILIQTTKITVLLVMAHSPAWHCASDPSQHTFCPRAYHCYATKMYYTLTTLCLSICNLDFGWINSCMDPLRGDEREKNPFWHAGAMDFFSKWNLEMSSAAIERRGNLSYLMKGGQHLLLQSEVKSFWKEK